MQATEFPTPQTFCINKVCFGDQVGHGAFGTVRVCMDIADKRCNKENITVKPICSSSEIINKNFSLVKSSESSSI